MLFVWTFAWYCERMRTRLDKKAALIQRSFVKWLWTQLDYIEAAGIKRTGMDMQVEVRFSHSNILGTTVFCVNALCAKLHLRADFTKLKNCLQIFRRPTTLTRSVRE